MNIEQFVTVNEGFLVGVITGMLIGWFMEEVIKQLNSLE